MGGSGTVSGVIATVQPLSFHLITFSRMAGRGRQDVAVTGAITVGDETLRRFLNRVEIGLDGASTAGASAGRPFWQSTHTHAAMHLRPSLKQSQ